MIASPMTPVPKLAFFASGRNELLAPPVNVAIIDVCKCDGIWSDKLLGDCDYRLSITSIVLAISIA